MPICSPLRLRFSTNRIFLGAILFAVLAACVHPAFAGDNDRVSFGERIVVNENETSGDLVCFLCAIEIHGKVDGDVVSFLGGVKNDGAVRGDMVSFLGDVNLAGTGSVGGDMVVMGGSLRKGPDAHLGADRVVFPIAIFFVPLLVVVGIVWGLRQVFRRRPVYFVPRP